VIVSIRDKRILVRALFLSVHSRTRNTVQPCLLSARATRTSLRLLTTTFKSQNATLLLGGRLHRLHPCQKQPSTKIATFVCANTKSGFPGNSVTFIFHPDIARRTRCARKRLSVVRPWRGFTRDMIRERAVWVTRSIDVICTADQGLA
jgi:hypothetical protein